MTMTDVEIKQRTTMLTDPSGAHTGSLETTLFTVTVRCLTCPTPDDEPLVVVSFGIRANTSPDRGAKEWRRHINPQKPRPRIPNCRALIVEFIRSTLADRGYPPSIREICAGVGLVSPSSAAYQVQQLAERGVLTYDPDRPHSIRLLSGDCAHCGGTGHVGRRLPIIPGGEPS